MNQVITVLAITVLAALAIVHGSEYAKDINIAAVAGLVGYLSGEKR